MDLLTSFFIYLLIWWLTLFTILHIGVSAHEEKGTGADAGAPAHPHLRRKLMLTTAIAAFILAIIHGLVAADVIKWHEWFAGG
jgi:predicted secreted protein